MPVYHSVMASVYSIWMIISQKCSFIFGKRVKLFCGIFLYFTIGCIVYNYFEGWDTITALNFSFVTISTVGYGYQSPTSDNSRIFTIFYMLFGIYFIFCTISELFTKRFDALIEYAKKTSTVGTNEVGSSLRRNRLILLALIVAQIVVVIIGALLFKYLQPDWSLVASIYFAIETSTTVGYGDLPLNADNIPEMNVIMIVYITISTVVFAFAFNTFAMIREEQKQLRKSAEIMLKHKDLGFITELDKGDGVREEQFILAVLCHVGVLDFEKNVKPWQEKFRGLDPDQHGRVFVQSLEDFSQREAATATEEIERINCFTPSTVSENVYGLDLIFPVAQQTVRRLSSVALSIHSDQLSNAIVEMQSNTLSPIQQAGIQSHHHHLNSDEQEKESCA